MPFVYGGGSTSASNSTLDDGTYQAVGFAYSGAPEQTPVGAADGAGEGLGLQSSEGEGAGRGVGVALQEDAFLPRFVVPADLVGRLPTTERMHKVR